MDAKQDIVGFKSLFFFLPWCKVNRREIKGSREWLCIGWLIGRNEMEMVILFLDIFCRADWLVAILSTVQKGCSFWIF